MKSKKILVLALSAIMVFAMSITAFAATENDIIEALRNAGIAQQYITQAEKFLADNDVSATQADAVITQINAAKTTAKGATTLEAMTADQKAAIIENIKAAATAVGATATIDTVKNEVTISKVDAAGKTNVYVASANVGQPTGVSTYATVTVIAGLAIALVACGVVVSKKKLA